MKHRWIFLAMLATAMMGFDARGQEMSLTEWRMAPVTADGAALSEPGVSVEGWYRATVPSTVMGALVRDNGLWADILDATNYKNIDRARFDGSWWYRTEFDLTDTEGKYIDLRFEGISYRANVWLNGVQIARADETFGTFRRWGFDITHLVREHNTLAVEVFRAQAGEPNTGYVDWNPRPTDESMGLFREVKVRVSGPVVVENTWVRTDLDTAMLREADLTFETDLTNHSDSEVTGTLTGKMEGMIFNKEITLAAGETRRVRLTPADVPELHIDNPRVWWCVGLGSPEMYDLDVMFTVGGQVSSAGNISFGIRTIDTYFTPEGYKGYVLNGKRVLIKGAGWTDDIFMRDTRESNERQVRYVKDMNLNTIRFENIWGTDQSVYEACDRHGIMAMVGWSCQWEWEAYLGTPEDDFMSIRTPEDIALVTRYLHDQVLWLRNHPSIIAWYGGSDKLARPELERAYMELLPQIDNRPYVGSAKAATSEVTGPSGMKMAGPYEYVGPNYWFTDTRNGGAFGFNTETGPGAQLPVRESIERFIPADELWPMGPSWSYHCTTSGTAMNSLAQMTEVIDARYGAAADLDDYLRKADLVSYESTRSMFEAFRANKPRTTGLIQWMLNSAWPSMYWQLYDYYGIPTSSYWATKRANNPWQLVYNYKDNGIYLVNELGKGAEGMSAVVKTYGIDSHPLTEKRLTVTAAANSSKKICQIDPTVAKNTFVVLTLYDRTGARLADNFYTLSARHDVYNYADNTWYMTPIAEYADFKALADVPVAKLKVTASPCPKGTPGKIHITVKNTSHVMALYTTLKLICPRSGKPLADTYWSDNYISLAPGESRHVECDASFTGRTVGTLKVKATGWNVDKTLTSIK
jgi:exo-1,4-beta-D-glucosaminidase